jgi:hypothetical protein
MAAARTYRRRAGDSAVKGLAVWVRTQRNPHRCNDKSRVEALNALGFEWAPLQRDWLHMYAQLVAYADAHGGSTEVSQHDEVHEALAQWLIEQRMHWREGKLASRPERIAKLAALGVTPDKVAPEHTQSSAQRNEATWRAWFELLREFADAHGGSTDVPFAHVHESGKRLGEWVANQRAYHHKAGKLSTERTAQLASLGFHSSAPQSGMRPAAAWNDAWNERCEQLAAYAAANGGSVAVPTTIRRIRNTLGEWLSTQRALWREGKLAPERVAKLEALGVKPDLLRP